jgi:hypothetical protein
MLLRKLIFILLLACMELASFSGVVQGSIYCQNAATGDSRIENSTEQADCHGQDDGALPFEGETTDCIDTPLERTIAAEQVVFDSSWMTALAPFPPILTVLAANDSPSDTQSGGVVRLAEACGDPLRIALRSVVLVI